MRVVIPTEKLNEIINECKDWEKRRTATKKSLQKLAGQLNHVAKCVEPARRFMTRIFEAIRATPHTGQHPLTTGTKADVKWFIDYATTTNGVVLLPQEERRTWLIECDSTLQAGGAYSSTR